MYNSIIMKRPWRLMAYKATTVYRKRSLLAAILILSFAGIKAQYIQVDGKLKVTAMDTLNTENLIVIKQADGTLGTRQLSSLPAPSLDSTRTLVTDLLVANLLCSCGSISYFLMESLLASGYSIEDLLMAGVSLDNMADNGVSPIDVFNLGIPADSLYGLPYRGGIIFYLDTLDLHPFEGLVCPAADQAAFVKWLCSDTILLAQDTAIGTGVENTIAIFDSCMTVGTPAYLCVSLSIDGYDDWSLPSKDELNAMYTNLHLGGLGSFVNSYYFTSSFLNGRQHGYQSFLDGSQEYIPPPNIGIMAVRAFRPF